MVEKLGMASLGASAFRVHHIFAKSSPYHNTTCSILFKHLADSFYRYNSPSIKEKDKSAPTTPLW